MNNLTKKELLTIISKMKKQELLDILQIKYGGDNLVSRTPIEFKELNNKKKNNSNNNIMRNDKKYNEMYIENIQ